MDPKVKMRLQWVQHYQETRNAGLTCRRCGISRPTLRKWVQRFEQHGVEGLQDQSRRPKHCPPPKVLEQHRQWIVSLRKRRLGSRRIQSELLRLYHFSLSTSTIHKVLKQLGQKPLQASRRLRKGKKRYQKEVPGERVQMDVCKIASQLYQYTAIDDCTRVKVVSLYPNKKAHSTLAFLEQIIETFPFPIQRLQTDRGEEFMAHAVQQRLMALHIKFRPTKPRSPHLNGKVERTQRIDLEEFYSQVDLKGADIPLQLQQWQSYYNHQRRHGSLNQAPWQKWLQLAQTTPSWEQVIAAYDPTKERIRDAYYLRDIGRPKKVIRL
ncbi:MAG TPA: IS481 family transposase [Candidatus Caenarcaniphilales bacterium]